MTDQQKIRKLKRAIHKAMGFLENLPSGFEPDPDPKDVHPEDATAHYGALAYYALQDALSDIGGRK